MGRDGHLTGAVVPQRAKRELGARRGTGGCRDQQAGLDFSTYLFSAPRDSPWMVADSLGEMCPGGVDGFQCLVYDSIFQRNCLRWFCMRGAC